jgi:hypothetical protein
VKSNDKYASWQRARKSALRKTLETGPGLRVDFIHRISVHDGSVYFDDRVCG